MYGLSDQDEEPLGGVEIERRRWLQEKVWLTIRTVWQRIPVAVSCALFAVLSYTKDSAVITVLLFIAIVLLACPEKLAAVANMVAVERDWVCRVRRYLPSKLETERMTKWRLLSFLETMKRCDEVCLFDTTAYRAWCGAELTEPTDLNAVMRRIDLFCKLVAPLIISAVDAYSSLVAVWVVLAQNVLSAAVEYYAIAQVRGPRSSSRWGYID